MKKTEQVYREILHEAMEKKNRKLTQKAIASALGISLSTVNHALKPLRKMNAVEISPKNMKITSVKKTLYYWSSIRNIEKDIIYETRAEMDPKQIEKSMPAGVVFTAYSGYVFRFKDAPADYSEIYVYSGSADEIKRRFPERKGPANITVLKKDRNMKDEATLANLFVDLWNLKQWYARDFLKEMEARLDGILA
ncbi:MAG: winged helix-turn-helix transcriptional regulator [Candidatus Woesearchaeota archaeon]